jgi:hypothetical protein
MFNSYVCLPEGNQIMIISLYMHIHRQCDIYTNDGWLDAWMDRKWVELNKVFFR